MKFYLLFICCILQVLNINGRVLPKRLPEFCSKSHSDYNTCTTNVLRKMRPHLLKGVREINFPRTYPLEIPFFLVNRTISEIVSIATTIRNVEIWGFEKLELKSFRFDTNTLRGEVAVRFPYMRVGTDFDVSGRLLTFDLDNSGYFQGNFSNIDLLVSIALRPVDKLGVKYYEFEEFDVKGYIADGRIKFAAKNPDEQEFLNGFANFFNASPRLIIDAAQPIFDEALNVFYGSLMDKVIASIPAEELLPE